MMDVTKTSQRFVRVESVFPVKRTCTCLGMVIRSICNSSVGPCQDVGVSYRVS